MELNFTLEEIDDIAKQFIPLLNNSKIVVFIGEMGAGKTTFIHAICRQMGIADKMSSPTYAIINQYETTDNTIINHIDLYRLNDTEEAIQAGVEDAINSGDFCFIEWPQKIMVILPLRIIEVFLEITGSNERRIIIKLT